MKLSVLIELKTIFKYNLYEKFTVIKPNEIFTTYYTTDIEVYLAEKCIILGMIYS